MFKKMRNLEVFSSKVAEDERGVFHKQFSLNMPRFAGFEVAEVFMSQSCANVIRGMHFQSPPCDHGKIVTCHDGEILDVVVDLRAGATYGAIQSNVLNAGCSIFIPRGYAHGFYSIEKSWVSYVVDHAYSKEHDTGILWDSIGFDWPSKGPIVSKRDECFVSFEMFETPFKEKS